MHTSMSFSRCSLSVLSWLLLLLLVANAKPEEYKTYIIHMDHSQKPSFLTHESWHRSTLHSVSESADKQDHLLYSYKNVMHGFSAMLTPSQVSEIKKSPAHVAIHEESFGKLLTTHSPKFLGLRHSSGLWLASSYGEGMIIGLIDSGVWPESASFNDKGMPPIPHRWKGKCENSTASPFPCNRKLIGAPGGNHVAGASQFEYASGIASGMAPRAHLAMYKVSNTEEVAESDVLAAMDQAIADGIDIMSLSLGFEQSPYFRDVIAIAIQVNNSDQTDDSPRDHIGHGTHTLSTARGNHVAGASQFGYASGIASGMAPRAHLAMYKVSNTEEVSESDVLAAMDQAIADGIDIMSLSLGFEQSPYFRDVIAIGSLSAYEKGIVVVCAAGNDGAYNSTLNAAPWITTVGAGTLDRSFIGTVTLGNGLTFEGRSTFPESVLITNVSFYHGIRDSKKRICQLESLNKNETSGKVVFCDYAGITIIDEQISELYRIGALAAIVVADKIPFGTLDDLTLPILVLPLSSGNLVREYVKGEPKPEVMSMRFLLTSLGTKPAPEVAYFSSRGPNPISPGILKPDVIAPGVDVLAAVPPFPKIRTGDYALATDYAFDSGTSMSTPHVAGVAALLKTASPNWSPAAIRSALMTTAYTINNNGTTMINQLYVGSATPLDYGAGHINPNKALDSGLIYDMDTQDYINFLCGLGYNDTEMRAVLRRNQWNCTRNETDLNYPSFSAVYKEPNSPRVKNFSRVVTNVGDDQSVFQAVVGNSKWLRIIVEPSTLMFTKKYQKQSFVVSVEIDGNARPEPTYGYLKWIDQHKRTVSSPIVALIS
ncbi:putative Subtilisin-like serine protease 2 [Hibiscus syriacus]|uniref:Subtilisin-like serine protease 2 n=1 Tax=Hibiscus syriacus TaxID=106335 RepID=A0A6A3BBN1_HIBSY|nr:putative Subtilisin-like serine protease 2 [Hibiscus syriacus]